MKTFDDRADGGDEQRVQEPAREEGAVPEDGGVVVEGHVSRR